MLGVNWSKVKYFEIKEPLFPLSQISKVMYDTVCKLWARLKFLSTDDADDDNDHDTGAMTIATRTLSLGSLKLD